MERAQAIAAVGAAQGSTIMVAKCRPCWLFDPHSWSFCSLKPFFLGHPKKFPKWSIGQLCPCRSNMDPPLHFGFISPKIENIRVCDDNCDDIVTSLPRPHRPPWNWTCSFPPSYPKLDPRKKAGRRDVKREPGIFCWRKKHGDGEKEYK